MSWVATAIAGVSAGVGIYSSISSSNAAKDASKAQQGASQAGIDEQRRQLEELQKLLSPYVEAGSSALAQQQALIGAAGPEAQQQAIQRIEESPQFEALTQAGEEGILQNASATGGLRGGNTQRALSQYRPQVLNSLIDQQYNRLGGIVNLGQNSAAGVGAAGQQTGAGISDLLGQIGAHQAGGIMGSSNAFNQGASNVLQGISGAVGLYNQNRTNQPSDPILRTF